MSAPSRVVSLVPSITESLFDLGLGHAVVGITDYCIHPAEQLSALPRIGGTKNPRVAEIVALRPDVVFANQEENTPAAVHSLQAAGIPVVVNFPQTVQQALADLDGIAELFDSGEAREEVSALRRQMATVRAQRMLRVFCPIWQDETGDGLRWWMTVNKHTFTHDLLDRCGLQNVFAERERRYPLDADLGPSLAVAAEGRDTRYPRLTAEEVLAAEPDLILLPSEPYAFGAHDAAQVSELFAVPPERVHLIDGSLVTWPGTRMGRAVQELLKLS